MGKQRHYRSVLSSGPQSQSHSKPRAARFAASAFDSITARVHHPALNAPIKRVNIRASTAALAHSQAALAQDLTARHRQNRFKDARIGAHETDEREAMQARRLGSARAMKLKQSSKFDLHDSGAETLTHGGHALADYHAPFGHDDAEDEVADTSFVTEPSGAPRTHAEVMAEVLAKSKLARAERAASSLAQSERANNIDEQFREIRAMLKTKDRTNVPEHSVAAELADDAADDFTVSARMLANEARGRATDRVKTAEELAREERDKLEVLEKARRARMRANNQIEGIDDEGTAEREDENGDSDAADVTEPSIGSKRKRRRDAEKAAKREARAAFDIITGKSDESARANIGATKRARTDDDLDVNFAFSDSDEDETGADPAPSDTTSTRTHPSLAPASTALDALPFTFPCPMSHAALLALLTPHPLALHPLALHRILACNALALAAENRAKMEIFYEILLQHIDYTAHHIDLDAPSASLGVLDAVSALLAHLTAELPQHAAAVARKTVRNFSAALTGGDLVVSRVLLHLFPSSDYRHSVTTPIFLALAQRLDECTLTSADELGQCLLAAHIISAETRETKRIVPELLHAFERMAGHCAIARWGELPSTTDLDAVPRVPLSALLGERLAQQKGFPRCSLAWFAALVRSALERHADTEACVELFSPLADALRAISALHVLERYMRAKLTALAASRAPLSVSSLLTPLRTHAPVFVSDYQPGRSYDPNRERAQLKQLKHEMASEKKGAEKDVRRVAQATANLVARQHQARAEHARKQRAANFADMESQARDSNTLHRMKRKKF